MINLTTPALAVLLTDGYKTFHGSAMHEELTRMYGNFTNRSGRLSNLPDNALGGVVNVGLQAAVMVMVEAWNETFFNLDKEKVCGRIKAILDSYLGIDYDVSHYEALHDLGRLPLTIKGVPEGTITPYGVAPFTVQTDEERFQWLALYVETYLSAATWHSNTNATTAAYFMYQAKKALKQADLPEDMLPFMIHDFSMRGLDIEATGRLGYSHLAAGHAGTDTLPAILYAEEYYGADITKELVACSVKATEHSITTSFIMTYAMDNFGDTSDDSLFKAEVEYARKLLKENPTGILSYVADSFDFWRFVTEGLDLLKEDIMARDGTFVIRPDSGNPADVLCGTYKSGKATTFSTPEDAKDWAKESITEEILEDVAEQGNYPSDTYSRLVTVDGVVYDLTYRPDGWGEKQDRGEKRYYLDEVIFMSAKEIRLTPQQKGLVQILGEKFGTTYNGTVKSLNSHIGAIFGDSITVQVQADVYNRLLAKDYSPIVVLGAGSFSYQYVTRDTHGSAVKCTAAFKADGSVVDVCKNPKTDPGKKSAKGLIEVRYEGDTFVQTDGISAEREMFTGGQGDDAYITYLRGGQVLSNITLENTRKIVAQQLNRLV